ncbi:MFS transporter [Glaciihabitans sp. INWT7]|uniref:MFS transporter n=1 Tax=Glaciihabitans sp. INWT7 TaxID=2596912 RepID=UPI001627ECA1|nr:MFS transporter [Glaciihabitans sp. INWT7]QNE47738.1 MFS transporter [Glaciihabitans sp. INWT7]
MKTYLSLLKTRGVARIMAAQLVARFPNGMLSLAFLLHIEHISGTYFAAGLVLAATSIGQAIAGPLTSRWMGVWGMRRVLILTMIVCATAVGTIALAPALPIGLYMAIGFVGGLSTPPIQPAVRTIYPKMVNSRQLTPLFSLDASAQEVIWVLGPVITTFLAIQVSTVLAILVALAFLVGGGIWFISSPEVGRVRIPRSKRNLGAVLKKPAVLLATTTGFLLVGACAAVEAGVVSAFGDSGSEAGLVLGLFAVGSLIGGLALGHIPIGPWALARRLFAIFVGMSLAAVSLNFWWLAVTLLVAGIGIAPALAVMFAIVSSSVRFSETAEAYGWVGTGQLIGAAIGSAVAGFMIDRFDAPGAFWVAAAFAGFGFLIPTIFHRAHPDLRGRDASPIPDTEPIATHPG